MLLIIWGTLRGFHYQVHSANQKTTCAVVDVEAITYVYNPKKEITEKTTSPPKNKTVLQGRFKKKQRKPSSSLPLSSSSQLQIGKHKAASSEDEVDKEV